MIVHTELRSFRKNPVILVYTRISSVDQLDAIALARKRVKSSIHSVRQGVLRKNSVEELSKNTAHKIRM